jgi:UDP-N-acetylglucosamine acyltransferase
MNIIHETSTIGPNVKLGSGNYIGPYCYITGNTVIGDNNHFEAFCSIGTPAEHRDYFKNNNGRTKIGSNNIFREYTTVNAGTMQETNLENEIVMLRGSHVGHDSCISNKVNLSCNVLIGGHSILMEGCNLGLGAICHQFSVIGAYSMIGMGAIVTKTSLIEPGNVYIGCPAKFLKQNTIGLDRNNIDYTQQQILISKYKKIVKHESI